MQFSCCGGSFGISTASFSRFSSAGARLRSYANKSVVVVVVVVVAGIFLSNKLSENPQPSIL